MKNKNIVISVILVVIVVAIGAYLLSQKASAQKGTVVFGITDAAEDMDGVSSIFVTVDKVEMHSTGDNWVTVSSATKEYDLLVLKQSGAVALLASSDVAAGTYDQVRLMISKVVVIKNGVEMEAKLPSGELKIIGNIVVNADKTSSVVFDFIADKSLHITGNGKFIFAPVIRIEKQGDATVELKSNDEIDIKDGEKEDDENVGMDEKGEIKTNFELKGKFSIDLDDNIKFESDDDNDDDGDDQNDNEGKNDDDNDDDNKGKNEEDDKLILNFKAQNNSGLSGTATLSEDDGKVKVTLKTAGGVLGLLSSTEPAHIHLGSCAKIGDVKYPLSSVVNGKSETKLNVSMAQIKAGLPLAVNIHKSVAESSIYVACADLKF